MAERKRITEEWRTWRYKVRQLRALVRKLKKEPSPHGEKWERKMIHHYTNKVAELERREPEKYKG